MIIMKEVIYYGIKQTCERHDQQSGGQKQIGSAKLPCQRHHIASIFLSFLRHDRTVHMQY